MSNVLGSLGQFFHQSSRMALCLACGVLIWSPNLLANPVHGLFKVVKGKVFVVSPDGSSKPARIGQKVFPKDKIRADKNSRAKIVMVDKNEINITPETEVEIADYQFKPQAGEKKVLLNVIYGKIRAKVKQKYNGASNSRFQVKTPSAVAGVRGTDFFTSFNPQAQETKIVTFEGSVEFGVPGANGSIVNAVRVEMGQSSSTLAGNLPSKPIELPKSQLKAFDQGSDANLDANLPDDSGKREPASPEKSEAKKGPRQEARAGNQNSQRPAGPGQAGGLKGPALGPNGGALRPSERMNGEPREPSSLGPLPGSTFLPEDMVSGPEGGNFDTFDPLLPPPPPDGGYLAPLPSDAIPECDFCTDVIQEGTRSLILNVQHQ